MDKKLLYTVAILIAVSFLFSLFADLGYITGNIVKPKEPFTVSVNTEIANPGEVIVITVNGGYWGVERRAYLYRGTHLKAGLDICEKAPCKGVYNIEFIVPDNYAPGIHTIKVYNYDSYVDDRAEANFEIPYKSRLDNLIHYSQFSY